MLHPWKANMESVSRNGMLVVVRFQCLGLVWSLMVIGCHSSIFFGHLTDMLGSCLEGDETFLIRPHPKTKNSYCFFLGGRW